jgi:hypothetical protein
MSVAETAEPIVYNFPPQIIERPLLRFGGEQ